MVGQQGRFIKPNSFVSALIFDEQTKVIGIFLVDGDADTKIEHGFDDRTKNYVIRTNKSCKIFVGKKVILCQEIN